LGENRYQTDSKGANKMKDKIRFNLWLAVGLTLALGIVIVIMSQSARAQGSSPQGEALGTAFTYQGLLANSTTGEPIAGPCDLRFSLYQSLSGNDPVGGTSPQVKAGVQPDNGFFAVSLDFGATAFTGEGRFLKIEVDCGGGYKALSPRVRLAPAPYALHAVSTGALHGYEVSDNAPSTGEVLAWDGSAWMPTASGSDNAWSLTGNSGTVPGTDFLGTTDNQPLELHVNGARALRLEPYATSANVIGGYSGNSVTAGRHGATIGGGGAGSDVNTVTDFYGTVAGGAGNTAGYRATVGGGFHNTAGAHAFVGGGWWNDASGYNSSVGGGGYNSATAEDATVGGGGGNTSSARGAAVSGGGSNDASGTYATIGGGFDNTASSGYGTTIGGGQNNVASNDVATVSGGEINTASGIGATVGGGGDNTASGFGATVPGGIQAKAPLHGQMAYASGQFASQGDAQASLYIMRGWTTSSGTWENLYLDGASKLLTIPLSRTLTFDILVVGHSDTGESAGYHCTGVIENVGWTTTLFGGGPCTELADEDTNWNAQTVADTINSALAVQVQGHGETIRWVATIRTAEVAW
jgi:hypothetical protein